jgi:hypothetical protein
VANGYDVTFMMALAIEAAGNDGREGLSETCAQSHLHWRSDPARSVLTKRSSRRVANP